MVLCGGEGTRLREFTEVIPKPLVPIGNRPILWHILRHYGNYGFRRFVLALGYKGEAIKDFMMNWRWRGNDFRFSFVKGTVEFLDEQEHPDWEVTFVNTGLGTGTGGRIKKLEPHLDDQRFMVTYGDGISDVPIDRLLTHHLDRKKTATLTGVNPFSTFGLLRFTRDNVITAFREKPRLGSWINGGYFVFEREVLDELRLDDVLEERPLRALAQRRQISIYKHAGLWRCVDTYKDWQTLNSMAEKGELEWLYRK